MNQKYRRVLHILGVIVLIIVAAGAVSVAHYFGYCYNSSRALFLDQMLVVVVLVDVLLWIRTHQQKRLILSKELELSTAIKKLKHANLNTIKTLVESIEAKDEYTRGHSERVTRYAVAIAKQLKLSNRELCAIRNAGVLHDVGKLGISDAILHKVDALESEEYDAIKKHPGIAEKIRMSWLSRRTPGH